MIVEVLDHRGHLQQRVRLERFPATIGRGYGSDVIVDDRHVCPTHLRITADEEGALWAEDAGTVNGTVMAGRTENVQRVRLARGVRLRVGQTVLRFHDSSQPVEPAVPMAGGGVDRLIDRAGARTAWALVAAGAVVLTLSQWLGAGDRISALDMVGATVAVMLLITLWASGWAVATRIVTTRFRFVQHLALAAAMIPAGHALAASSEWLDFLAPAARWTTGFWLLGWGAVSIVLFYGHLTVAATLHPRRRWQIGVAVTLLIGGLMGLAGLTMEDWSDGRDSAGTLKPLPASMVPSVSLDAFMETAGTLRSRVDALSDD